MLAGQPIRLLLVLWVLLHAEPWLFVESWPRSSNHVLPPYAWSLFGLLAGMETLELHMSAVEVFHLLAQLLENLPHLRQIVRYRLCKLLLEPLVKVSRGVLLRFDRVELIHDVVERILLLVQHLGDWVLCQESLHVLHV